ncbi:MAG: hypothetical protein ACLP01_08520 [Solirubrobacteraceae bacterium]
MLAPIAVAHKHLADYASLVGRPLVNHYDKMLCLMVFRAGAR